MNSDRDKELGVLSRLGGDHWAIRANATITGAAHAHRRRPGSTRHLEVEQAGYAVTIQPGHGYIVTNPSGHAIATLTSLDELRALADQFYERVWRG